MRQLLSRLWPFAVIAIGVLLVIYKLPVQHWLAIHTGTLNEPGPYYGFWSGFGSDLGEYVIIGGVIGAYRKHNCHTHRCPWIGKYPVANGEFFVCKKHHREITGHPVKLTVEYLKHHHEKVTNGD